MPSPTSTPTGGNCQQNLPANTEIVDGLAFIKTTNLGNLAYPSAKLPDNLPAQPYQMGQGSTPPTPSDVPAVNPALHEGGGGFVTSICNVSSTAHTIEVVQARIDTVTPYTSRLDVLPPCLGPLYTRQTGASGNGGCGGGDGQSSFLHAPFHPTDGAGTVVTAQQLYVNPYPGAPGSVKLPATVMPGDYATIEVGIGDPSSRQFFTTSGYYTFSFAFGIDGAAPVFVSTSPLTLLAPVAQSFSGPHCLTPSMQQQIPPATNPPTYYACP
jgi:hypothetical protein